MERRPVACLPKYWHTLDGGFRHVAVYIDIEQTKIGRAAVGQEWDWCFVLDCRDDAG